MNYIYIVNNIWQNVIHLDGYKHTYLVVYLSIVDSCNRFNWNNTPISIDVNLAKTKVSKKTFYEAISWLVKQNLIEYTSGKNAYQIAYYKIIEVKKCTTTNTATDTTAYTTTNTSTAPLPIPIIINNKHKTLNNKPKTSTEEKNLRLNCKNFFLEFYLKSRNVNYYWEAKDATNLIALISKIKAKVKEKNEKEKKIDFSDNDIFDGFKLIIENINDQWILDNFSIPNINSKFNDIFLKIKNGTSKKPIAEAKQQRTEAKHESLRKFTESIGNLNS